ncbi:Detected protein of confused Function [Hibiscus syriacus]|uniref:Detected protein of confused Function n=1 Tax=Hibiscus syriacus TaxID=106335 RepID=A0A6A2X7D9_HIBSY|nr:Detected protein of confused Function [Hibiscus syriacus]
MAAALKLMCVMGLIVLVSILEMGKVNATGECRKSSPDNEAMKLARIKNMGQNPSCLCAVLPSNTAKVSGIKLENAITIPKRCNFANRPDQLQMRTLYTSLK